MVSMDHEQYMRRALELALQAEGRTSPNPLVGAVIVRDGQVVGEGYHHKAGEPHAEVNALREAGDKARGAAIYVTLEPCCHHGRTGPCCEALIEAGITEVVAAMVDPNPKVAGQGIKRLEAAGIKVTVGILENEARDINQSFLKRIQTGLPYVILKTAMTLDGKIAAASGDSRWVTGEAARNMVHEMRNRYDAVMVGANTVLKDDPQLNVRLERSGTRNPVRVIVDGALDIPLTARVVTTINEQATVVLTSHQASQTKIAEFSKAGVQVIPVAGSPDNIDLEQGLRILAEQGISSIMVEGGGGLNWSLIKRGLIDYWYAFIAMKAVGGAQAPTPVGGEGFKLMNEAVPMVVKQWRAAGDDLLVEGWMGNHRRW